MLDQPIQPASDRASGVVEEEIYQGTVKIRLRARSHIRQILQFMDELCQKPEFRLLRMVGNFQVREGMDIWIGLREPLALRQMLLAFDDVSSVSAPLGHNAGGDEHTLDVWLTEKPADPREYPGEDEDTGVADQGSWQSNSVMAEEDGLSTPPSSLAQMLVESRVLSREDVADAQRTSLRERLPLSEVLVRDGLILPLRLAILISFRMGLTMVDLRNENVDPSAVLALPEEVARKYTVLPLFRNSDYLTVAMTDPTDLRLIHDLTSRTGAKINPLIATHKDIRDHIDVSYRLAQQLIDEPSSSTSSERSTARLLRAPSGRLTTRLLRDVPPALAIDMILRQALQDRASDVHFGGEESRLRVRFRIDGILHDVLDLPMDMHPLLISRLKILSGLNIAERRRAQDGQFSVEVDNRRVDIRVAISNTVDGEMAVLRLLDKGFTLIGLDQLGMDPQSLERYRQLLRLPYGIIIVCGPTGSGKSTTLYASLLQMNRAELNIITLEDPVEYHIADVNQMQVNTEAGVTFAAQLRSVLRLDPDVILVGEIRDQETATIATQAALTGHLVLTTLHANDAVSSLLRLRDLGVPSYLITSSVAGIVAQRMVRVICTGCQAMTPRPISEQEVYASEMGETREQFIYGAGCNMCARTGYRERSGVFETLIMSDALRQLFMEDAPRELLMDTAIKDGMTPIRRAGMQKVRENVTTPYEVMRVLFKLE